jgi:hypothetical protein
MAALAGLPPNGLLSAHSSNSINEVEEYEKILRIRDQVFAGSHPRLTVPAHALRKVSPRFPEVPPVPVQSHVEFVPPAIDHSSAKLPGLQTNSHATEQTTTNSAATLNGTRPPPQSQTPQPTASGIDPIFLTKSDELVRQETIFQRTRLEKQLREQFEKKKSDARNRPHPEEIKPEINISSMFTKVMDAVKPLAATKALSPPEHPSPSDSFDENSFYSSRAPDSTPEEGALSEHSPPTKHQVQPKILDNLDADGPVDPRTLHGQQTAGRDSPHQANQRPARTVHSNIPFPYDLRQDRGMLLGVDTVDLTSMDVDDDDEPEYSPPEPTEPFAPHSNDQASRFDYRDPRSRPLRRYSGADQHEKRPGSPLEADMRIVRNHIASPLAPQPSRVSPLAVAKAPPFSQNNQSRTSRNYPNGGQFDSSRQSPDYTQATEISRKKRKLDKKANRTKKRKGNMAGSPEAHIKDEPVSPPPFHDVQPLGALKPRTAPTQPIYIDDEPMQQIRYATQQDRYGQPTSRQVVYEEPSVPRSDPRPFSRASVRPLMREEQDLRRVASLHNMRTEHPAAYVDVSYNTPTRVRASSHAVVESPHSAPIRSNREPIYAESRQDPRGDRAMGSPVPPFRVNQDVEVRYRAPGRLPPQQGRLVEDEDGNQYYEVITHQPVAPRHAVDVEAYNDNTYGTRHSRTGSVYVDPPMEKQYLQDMPPPRISYRRVGEVPHTPVVGSRQMADPSQLQRSASVQVLDYPTRQPIYADNRIPTRASVRISGVRPQGPRYEDVRVPVARVQSVRPGGREGSVFMDERPQVQREYISMQAEQQPVFRRVVQDGQYYDVQDPRY